MFKYIANKIECFFLGHDDNDHVLFAQNFVLSDVVVGEKTIDCVVTIESELVNRYRCDRCGKSHRTTMNSAVNTLPLKLDIAYLTGLYSDGDIEKAETFFLITLFYPTNEILCRLFTDAIVEGYTAVEALIEDEKRMHRLATLTAPWGPVGGKNILAYRDELIETERNLSLIDTAIKTYQNKIQE